MKFVELFWDHLQTVIYVLLSILTSVADLIAAYCRIQPAPYTRLYEGDIQKLVERFARS